MCFVFVYIQDVSEVAEEGICPFSLGRFLIRTLLRDKRILFLFPPADKTSRRLGRKHDSMIFLLLLYNFFRFLFSVAHDFFSLKFLKFFLCSFFPFVSGSNFVFLFLFVAVGLLSLYISLLISCCFICFPLYICLFCVLAMI